MSKAGDAHRRVDDVTNVEDGDRIVLGDANIGEIVQHVLDEHGLLSDNSIWPAISSKALCVRRVSRTAGEESRRSYQRG